MAGIAGKTLTIATAATTFTLNPGFAPWLMGLILAFGVVCLGGRVRSRPRGHIAPHDKQSVPRTVAAAIVLVCVAGPAQFSVSAALSGHADSTLSAGPNGSGRHINHAFNCAPKSMLNENSAAYMWVPAAGSARVPEGCQLASGTP